MLPKHAALSEAVEVDDLECFLDLPGEEAAVRLRVYVEQDRALATEDEVHIVVVSVLFDNMDSFLKSCSFKVLITHLLDEGWMQLPEAGYHSM